MYCILTESVVRVICLFLWIILFKTHPLTTAFNNQMSSALSMLQSFIYKHITCSWVEGHYFSLANAEKVSENRACLA